MSERLHTTDDLGDVLLSGAMSRRSFLQLLGAGLLVTTYADVASGAPGLEPAPEGAWDSRLVEAADAF
ncbi:hypothetical protein CMK11_17205, partial [Candidatus Poribacteria bacterium]|nr:hypothetical protein [Candidatus Poribacteria bacterium]